METKDSVLENESEEFKCFKKGFKEGFKEGVLKKETEFIRNMLAEGCSIELISKISNRH